MFGFAKVHKRYWDQVQSDSHHGWRLDRQKEFPSLSCSHCLVEIESNYMIEILLTEFMCFSLFHNASGAAKGGSSQLLRDQAGYLYQRSSYYKNKTYWKCWMNGLCKARAISGPDLCGIVKGCHTHSASRTNLPSNYNLQI